MRAVMAFCPISMCNHSASANADFRADPAGANVPLTANRDIAAGEEIPIDYEDFSEKAIWLDLDQVRSERG